MDLIARRSGLRTRLLVGVASMALAAPISRGALAQDAAKWSPYIELGGMGGNTHSFGDVDIFIPVWQDQTSLLFGDLRGTFSTEPTQEGNFGLGYRTQLNTDWILGGYGYFDIQNSKNDNLFYQATLGVELLSVDWDFRLNGYIPFNPDGGTVDNHVGIGISGNNIQMQTSTKKEKALYGFDGEVGWRLPVFPVDGDLDIRVYAGGYYFANSDVDTIAGPRGRIEARLYDIDFLGLQSRLTAQGVIQWDQPRGTQGFGGLELRIPLGAVTGNPGPKLNPLDRRMVDRVQRDVDIVTEETAAKSRNEDVIVDELTVSTHTIVFANRTGGGSGAQGSPTDVQNAVNIAQGLNGNTGSNAIILADGGGGPIGVTNPLQLSAGQALIGGGSKVLLTGAKTGEHVNFRFPGTRPTLSGNDSTSNLIQMQPGSQNEIFGLNLTGAFSNGIFGHNIDRAIVKENSISGAIDHGVLLQNKLAGIPPSAFVDVSGNDVTGASGAAIAVFTYVTSGAHAQSVTIAGNVVTLGGGEGIFVSNGATGAGSALSQNLFIAGNTVASNNGNGIEVFNAARFGGTISQTAALDDNVATHNSTDGVFIYNQAVSGAISQNLTVDPNTLTYNGFSGIRLKNIVASNGATIRQTASIADNTINGNGGPLGGNYGFGIAVFNNAVQGSISQSLAITGNAIIANSIDGIFISQGASSGGVITQIATIANDRVVGNGGYSTVSGAGIAAINDVFSSGTINQTLGIANSRVSYNDGDGIRIVNRATGTGALVNQTATIANVVASYNNGGGIFFANDINNATTGGASLNQTIVIDPSTINGNLFGIAIVGKLYNGSFAQNVQIASNTVDHNFLGGIFVQNTVGNSLDNGTTTLTQNLTVYGNTIAGNGGRLTVTSTTSTFTFDVTGGGVDIALFANNTGTSGTVNLSSSIDIANNLFASNFVRYAGTSGPVSIGQNLSVTESGSNGADHGTVNMVGNRLTVEDNRFLQVAFNSVSGVSPGLDVAIQAFAINDGAGGSVVSGAVNLLNNTTTIRGNSFDGDLLFSSLGVNGSSSSGITAGGISFAGNFTTVQDNNFGNGGLFINNMLVNGTDGAGVSGGSVALANNTMAFEGNSGGGVFLANTVVNGTDHAGVSGGSATLANNTMTFEGNYRGQIIISNLMVNGSDSSGVSGGATATMANNHTTIEGNSGFGVFIANQVVNGTDSGGVTNGVAVMSSNVTTIDDNFLSFGGITVANVAVNGTDGSHVTSGFATMTGNAMTIDGNVLSAGSILAANVGVNGTASSGVNSGEVTLAGNAVTIANNRIVYEATSSATGQTIGIFVLDQGVNGSDSSGVTNGVVTLSSNAVTVANNQLSLASNVDTFSNGLEIVVGMLGENGVDSGSITSSVVTLANNAVTVTNNSLLYTGNLGFSGTALIEVFDAVSAESGIGSVVNLSDHLVISNNTITGYNLRSSSSGIFVIALADNGVSGGTASAVENTTITGNHVDGPIFMIADVGNSASNGVASMTNNFTIADNTASGIEALNIVGNSGTNGAVSMGNVFSITDNVVVGGTNPNGIGVINVLTNEGGNGTASMTNSFSINDNDVSGGVFVLDEAVNGTTSSAALIGTVRMSNAITIERNTIAGDSIGIFVGDNAFNTGGAVSLSSTLDIDQNVVSRQEAAGMQFVAYASASSVSQGAQLKNNTVTSNGLYIGSTLGGFGIAFIAHHTGAGSAIQNFALSGNVISDNTSDGINTKASGGGAAQTITLATGSGNHINANAGFGAYLTNNGGTVVFNIDGNDLSGNSDGRFSTAGVGITVNDPP